MAPPLLCLFSLTKSDLQYFQIIGQFFSQGRSLFKIVLVKFFLFVFFYIFGVFSGS